MKQRRDLKVGVERWPIRGDFTISRGSKREAVVVVVTIRDDGCGIPEEAIERLFDPFFTTKPGGEGTGLGLVISHEIVRKHGGEIAVESALGRGTTVRIRLPVAPP